MVYLVPLGNKVEDEIYWEEDKLPKTRVTSGYTVTIVTGDKGKHPGDVLVSHRTLGLRPFDFGVKRNEKRITQL